MKHLHLLLDEHLPLPKSLPYLDKNHNLKHVKFLKIRGHDDEDVYMEAKKQKRILITGDSEFYYKKRYKHYTDVGVIYIVSSGQNYDLLSDEIEEKLKKLFSTVTEKDKYYNVKIRLTSDKAKFKDRHGKEKKINLKHKRR